jgi:hypothetical protein
VEVYYALDPLEYLDNFHPERKIRYMQRNLSSSTSISWNWNSLQRVETSFFRVMEDIVYRTGEVWRKGKEAVDELS